MNPSGEQYELHLGEQRAVVAEVGAGLREYAVDGSAVVDGYALDEMCSGGAGQILAPWPNRIGGGRYTFEGRALQLALTEPARGNAIHGLVRWVPWSLTRRDADSVTLRHQVHPQPGYPFCLELSVRWSLGSGGLSVEHEATNVGPTACPFGLGVHPYLIVLGSAVDDLRLHLRADRWLEVDAAGLPIQEHAVAGSGVDFGEPRPIGAAQLDTAYTGLTREQGRAKIALAAPQGHGVELWMDESFTWAQVFTGDTLDPKRRRRSVAIEPMTCPPNAFQTGVGRLSLMPGQRWRGTWGIRKT